MLLFTPRCNFPLVSRPPSKGVKLYTYSVIFMEMILLQFSPPSGITTVLTTVSMTNNVQKVNPVSSNLRSLDVFLLICLLFVFGALLELAITGMADPKGAGWWKRYFLTLVYHMGANPPPPLKTSET